MDDLPTFTVDNEFFDLTIKSFSLRTQIDLDLKESFILTNSLPATVDTLNLSLPSIFQHICFNPKGLSFQEEVENTEFGHLFEHILIEYLQLNKDKKEIIYEGETRWNWKKEPKGKFHIEINVVEEDKDLLIKMIEKTIQLLTQIITSSQIVTQPVVTHMA